MLTVTIENFNTDSYTNVLFSEHEFKRLNDVWKTTDKMLVGAYGKKYGTWAALTPDHWYKLLTDAVGDAAKLAPHDQIHSNPVVKRLHFILVGTKKCLEILTVQTIDTIRIQICGDEITNFQFHSSFVHKADGTTPPSLSIVVDNGY